MCIDSRLQFVRCKCKLISFYFYLHSQLPNTNHRHNFYFYSNFMYIVWCLYTRVHNLLAAVQVPWLKKRIFAMVHKMFHLPFQLPVLSGQIWSMFFFKKKNISSHTDQSYWWLPHCVNNTVENQLIKYFKNHKNKSKQIKNT